MNRGGGSLAARTDPGTAARTTASVCGCEDVADGIRLITLRPDSPIGPLLPGSHLDVTVELSRGPAVRSYSLVDLGADDELLRIAVRLDAAGGGGSAWMHALTPGARLGVRGPISEFAPSSGEHPSVLLAGGIGITAILGLARAIRAGGSSYRVIYAGRRRASMAFADHLAQEHPGRVQLVESSQGTAIDPVAVVDSVPPDGVLYVCGPMRLLADVRAAWQQAGRPATNLRFETFGTSGILPTRPFRVSVASHGVVVDVPTGTSLLDALEDAGVEVMYDCLRGECGLCRVKVISVDGDIDHRDVFLSVRQRSENLELCACVSRVAGRSITIEC